MFIIYSSADRVAKVEDIQWDDRKHSLIINSEKVSLTRTEYQLLVTLKHGSPVTYANMALAVYNCYVDEQVRMMIDKHIDRIRRKMRGSGIYVYCVLSYGYVMFQEKKSVRRRA